MDERLQGAPASEMYACHLPNFGEASARISHWLVTSGDTIEEDQPLVVIETSGGLASIESAVSGILVQIEAVDGETVPVGGVLAIINVATTESAPEVPSTGPSPAPPPSSPKPAQRRAQSAGTTAASAPTPFPTLNLSPINSRIQALNKQELIGSDRIAALRLLYDDVLLPLWNRFAHDADAWCSAAEDWATSKRAEAQTAHEHRVEAIHGAYRRGSADAERELEAAHAELNQRLALGNELVRKAWSKVGPGLDLPLPEPELARLRAAAPGSGAGPGESIDILRGRSTNLKQIPRKSEDKALTRYWWWAALGVTFVTLGFGLWISLPLGLASGAAVYFFREHQRAEARREYEALLKGVSRDQATSNRDLESRTSKLEATVAVAKAHMAEQVAASEAERDEVFSQVHSEQTAAWDGAGSTYNHSKGLWEDAASTVSEGITSAVGAAPQLFAPWHGMGSAGAASSKDLPYAAQVRLRIGQALSPQPLRSKLSAAGVQGLVDAGPWSWSLAEGKSLMFIDGQPSGEGRESFAAPILARLLNQLPPGKAHLTLFDPIGLGRNFGAFVRLGDYSDQLINGRVWSNADDIKQRLRDLIGHIERVTQKYLRNEHRDIESYNSSAGEIAEPYRILVLADFPECFDEDVMRDLLRIAQNGPRCGVFVIMHANISHAPPRGIDLDILKPFFVQLQRTDQSRRYHVLDGIAATTIDRDIELDTAPEDHQTNEIVKNYGEGALAALKVEVPYERMLEIAGCADGVWDASSIDGISVPLGPAGGKKVQMIELGKGLCHHALLTGRPGSGKSNLLHVFITTAARLYSPEELQLYLVDFKQGVEFKAYAEARLPHARVIAVESEREFGLSVLQGLEAEMLRRGELFRSTGAENIADYRRKSGAALPRVVLVIDEFQEFFVRDDKLKREATTLIGRLVSQARYAGIHLFLGSQSLATASLERAVRDQMTVRIALQSSEADSRLILAEDNTAARSLTRPGEAIYNNDAGCPGGNSLFQVALFSGGDRYRQLERIAAETAARKWTGDPPVVFEGHEAGDMATCPPLSAPTGPASEDLSEFRLWVGEPTSLRPAISAPLKRQGGRHLIVLSREEVQGVGVIMAAMMSLAAQTPPTRASFQVVDLTSADSEWADHPEVFAEAVPHAVDVTGRHDFKRVLGEVAAEVKRRAEDGVMKDPSIFLVLLGVQRIRELKSEGGSSITGSLLDDAPIDVRGALGEVLRDGPEVGVHVLAWCDAYSNLDKALDSGGISELGLKISGPLSDQESRRLFDEDAAAQIDKPHRMILADDERVGVLETFRPYGLPSHDFIKQFGAALTAPRTPKRKSRAPTEKS